jgi:hypothetical protein
MLLCALERSATPSSRRLESESRPIQPADAQSDDRKALSSLFRDDDNDRYSRVTE